MQKNTLIKANSLLTLVAGISLALEACVQNTAPSPNVPVPGNGSLTPVETKAPNSDYKPAFAGQTRIAGIKSATLYEGKVLTEALKSPWGITGLPDGRLLITEREDTMRIVTAAGQGGAPITGLPEVNAAGQGRLLGVRVDPVLPPTEWSTGCFPSHSPRAI